MKKYLSVIGLFARSSVYKALSVLSVTAVLVFGLFVFSFKVSKMPFSFDSVIVEGFIPFVFAASFVALSLILCVIGTEYRTKVGYTIKRLSITEKNVFLCQAIFNTLVYLLLWAAMTITVYFCGFYFVYKSNNSLIGMQAVFIGCSRNAFLHSVFPINDIPLLIRNIFLIIALGFSAAEFPFKQRRKKWSFTSIIMLLYYTLLFFPSEIGNLENCVITSIICVAVVLCTYFGVKRALTGEKAYEM